MNEAVSTTIGQPLFIHRYREYSGRLACIQILILSYVFNSFNYFY